MVDPVATGLIELRRHVPESDLVTALVHAEVEGGKLSYGAIISFLRQLINAAEDTIQGHHDVQLFRPKSVISPSETAAASVSGAISHAWK